MLKFQVEEFWKGDLTGEITVASDNALSSCVYPFEEGKSYLIFANIYKNNLFTGLCGLNKEGSKADEEYKILGKGKIPEKTQP